MIEGESDAVWQGALFEERESAEAACGAIHPR
jgi:hypothetical protein